MSLSKREKILLICLGVILLIAAYYQFIFTPQLAKINGLEIKVEELDNLSRITKMQSSSKNNIYKDFKVLNSNIYLITERFYPSIIQERLILKLDEIIEETKLDVSNISFTKPEKAFVEKLEDEIQETDMLEEYIKTYQQLSQKVSPIKAEESKEKENTKNGESEEEGLKEKVEKMTASLTFEGSYAKLITFIDKIEELNKYVIVDKLNLVQTEDGILRGSISLDYYALPKFHEQDEEYLKWDIVNTYGKDNPFKSFDDFSAGPQKESSSASIDFYISVNPITADIPTVIIGKAKDFEAKTYVYGDNPGVENVEFLIIKDNGKYFYKYKTEMDSYPVEYDNSMIEFTPTGDTIGLSIMSNKRKNDDDLSGINLSIINKTDLKLEVSIENDDPSNSRITFAYLDGDIVIK